MKLRHWTHPKKEIDFDPKSGKGKVVLLQQNRDPNSPCKGFSFKVISTSLKTVCFAVYKAGSNIMFAVGKKVWAINSPEVELHHSHKGKLISFFSVTVNGKTEFALTYLHPLATVSMFIDPTYDNIDYDSDFPLASITEDSKKAEWAGHVLANWS